MHRGIGPAGPVRFHFNHPEQLDALRFPQRMIKAEIYRRKTTGWWLWTMPMPISALPTATKDISGDFGAI